MPYAYDDSRWPLVVCALSGVSTDADIDEYIRTHEAAVARHDPHFVIVDARRGQAMSATHRRRIADWVSLREDDLRVYRIGLAFVAPSNLLRTVLTAIYWVRPPPYPTKALSTIFEAECWGAKLLSEHAGRSMTRLKAHPGSADGASCVSEDSTRPSPPAKSR